ncbi:MAG: formylglycine-generating enzyme family protein [Magnetococcales bacterium]|nr:formylglycine-generating enzyme family protein [Magnetococcales bacterium]
MGVGWGWLVPWLGMGIVAPLWAGENIEERGFADMPFVHLPGGCFWMGSPVGEAGRDIDEGPRHEVCLDGFWIGRHEVTQGEWLRVMGSNPAHFALSEHHPVERVSWSEVQKFLRKLNEAGEGVFRLPTEAEWEYAARAGTETPYAFGAGIDAEKQANFRDQSLLHPEGLFRRATTSVEQFPPNGWGLFDMHGNVTEWVADWYQDDFYSKLAPRQKNPIGNDSSSGLRVLRGGSWYDRAVNLRAADRGWSNPDNRHVSIGLRLARTE